jgi:hypothetical protein
MLLLTKKLIAQAVQTLDFFPSVTYYCFIYLGHGELFRNETRKKRKMFIIRLGGLPSGARTKCHFQFRMRITAS